jgi:hypothetical protein
MQTAIKTRAPETMYIIVPLLLAMSAVVIDILGSPSSAVGVALLAYSTSALGSILKM